MTAAIMVLDPGMHTTIQDMGRYGYQDVGVPISGALDKVSARLANALVGNHANTPLLEMILHGVTLEVQADSLRVALFGCDGELEIAGSRTRTIPAGRSARAIRGDKIRVTKLEGSLCSYLAIEGGLDVPLELGSTSTYVRGALGGLTGRPLQRNDHIPLVLNQAVAHVEQEITEHFDYRYEQPIRVVLGPQEHYFSAKALDRFLNSQYTVSTQADRMGFRLEGARLDHTDGYDLVSDGIVSGSIQVPGSGLPIVLLADAQTTGGYPKIATVISVDRAVLGRRPPGSKVRFTVVSLEEAEHLAREQEHALSQLINSGFKQRAPEGVLNVAALRRENLISGVV